MPMALAVSDKSIALTLEDGRVIAIDPKRTTGSSYSNEKHGRGNTSWLIFLAGGGLAPASIFNETAKATTHFIGIDYSIPDGGSVLTTARTVISFSKLIRACLDCVRRLGTSAPST